MKDSVILPPVMPLFSNADELYDPNPYTNWHVSKIAIDNVEDAIETYELAVKFLAEQKDNYNNFKAYRSEITTFLTYCWSVKNISLAAVRRSSIADYMEWCESPPADLIGTYNAPQFIFFKALGMRVPNFRWRPFRYSKNHCSELKYQLSSSASHQKLSILSLFFQYLNAEEFCEGNPASIVLKFGKYRSTKQCSVSGEDDDELKYFSDLQWAYMIDTVEELAASDTKHERTLFLVKLLYGTYCRISEISAHTGYTPIMAQFKRDRITGYLGFLIPRSKGGKRRTVSVSDELRDALIRYRKFLKLPDLPAPGEDTPLFVRQKAASVGRSSGVLNANLGIRQIREIVDLAIEKTAQKLEQDGLTEDAAEVRVLTVHSIRHTGISHDIANGRPLQHVQADAGHSSIDITSRYLHTSRAERYLSAKTKKLNPLA